MQMQQLTLSPGSSEWDSSVLVCGGGFFRLVALARARFLGDLVVVGDAGDGSAARRLRVRFAAARDVDATCEAFVLTFSSDIAVAWLLVGYLLTGRAWLLVILLLFCLAARCKAWRVVTWTPGGDGGLVGSRCNDLATPTVGVLAGGAANCTGARPLMGVDEFI